VTKITLLDKSFEKPTTLLIIPSQDYNKIISEIPSQLSNKKICYITLNKTYNALKETFNQNPDINTENIVIIDAITKSIGKVENKKDCYFITSPQALTELSIVLSEFLNYEFDYVILDSLTTLLIYQKAEEPIIKFLSNIVNKIKTSGAKGIFFVLNIEDHKLLIEESSMIMDDIINLEKEKIECNLKG
jgi:archaellum biogenesis ATPase FlaH